MGIHRDWSAYTRIGPWLFNFAHIDARYQKGPADQCWTWTGGLHRQGYGMCGGIEDQGNDTYRRFVTVVHRPLMMSHLNRALTHDDFVIKTCANNFSECSFAVLDTLGNHHFYLIGADVYADRVFIGHELY